VCPVCGTQQHEESDRGWSAGHFSASAMSRHLLPRVITVAIVGIGALARLAPLGLQRFHEDEALYSYWGLRIASGEDVWLAGIPIDKPPLFFYLQAGTFAIFGPSETSARLPSLLASVCSIGLLYLLGLRLYGRHTALVAAALLTASPFAISFAPTAFLDPLMSMLVLASCVAAVNGHWGWAAALLGLAGATKWEGVTFSPLVAGIGFCVQRLCSPSPTRNHAPAMWREPRRAREMTAWSRPPIASSSNLDMAPRCETTAAPSPRLGEGEDIPPSLSRSLTSAFVDLLRRKQVLRAAVGLLAIAVLLWSWDLARPQPSILRLLRSNYGGLALAPPDTWGTRLGGWVSLLRYVFYHPCLNALLVVGLPLLLLTDVRRLSQPVAYDRVASYADLLLVGFLALFAAVLTFVAVPVWDRYLLALVPFACLLLARVLSLPDRLLELGRGLSPARGKPLLALSIPRKRASSLLTILVAAFLLFTLPLPLRDAAAGRFPIGGDHGTYQGIEQVVAYFRGHVMGGAILYHRWLGNHYRYYMYRFPYAFRWWGTPAELAHDAAAASDVERWIVFPSWQDEEPARRALSMRELRLIRRYETYRSDGSLSFTIYQIEGP